MQELELLSNKLDALLTKYAALQAENKSLKETIQRQMGSLELLGSKIASPEENMMAMKLGSTVNDDDGKIALRKQLDGVIAEIDKILTSLND